MSISTLYDEGGAVAVGNGDCTAHVLYEERPCEHVTKL